MNQNTADQGLVAPRIDANPPERVQVAQEAPRTPQRIQLRRAKGWRKPAGAIVVARPSRWGNQWRALPTADGWSVFYGRLEIWLERVGIVTREQAVAECVAMYRLGIENWAEDEYGDLDDPLGEALRDLRGRDLCCWCPLDSPCHADVLIELANPPAPSSESENPT